MDTEGALAVETLTEVYIDHHAAQMKDYVRRSSREAPEWRRNAGSFATTTYLSAAEMAEPAAEFQTIVARYQDRVEDPSLRPEGSRPVRMLLTAWLPRPPA